VAALILAGEPALLVGMVLPSVSTALGLGFLASTGTLPLPVALATAAAAVIGGDLLGYWSGRSSLRRPANQKSTQPASARPGARWRRIGLSPARHAKIAALVARHGGRSIFLARWIVGARTLVPRLVGAAGTPLVGFARWSVPAGLVWSAAYVSGGYLAGDAYQRVSAVAGQISLALFALGTAALGAFIAGRWLGRHPTLPGQLASRARLLPRITPARTITGPAALFVVLVLLATGLSVLVAFAVQASGLPQLDQPVATALAGRPVNHPAQYLLFFSPGTGLIAAAAALALCRPVTSGRHCTGPLRVLAAGGGALPLVILTIVLHGVESVARRDHLFAVHSALLTTAIALGAWTLARKRAAGPTRVAIWTLGVAAVLLVATARIYVGWGTPSSTLAATLIGGLWAGVFAAAWTARPAGPSPLPSGRRGARAEEPATSQDGHRVTSVHHAVVQIG
jgi:undecaprenyl-diphosphatase